MSFVNKKWIETQFKNFSDKLESVFVKASSLATVAKSGKYTDLIDKPTLVGISANTLNELVEKIMYSHNLRSASGNVKITNGVIESLPVDWYQFIATWQNNYDQDACNIGLILVLSSSSFTNKWYRVSINGKKGSYTVKKLEYVEFGSNGAVIAKTNLTNNLLANVAGVSALDAAVGPVIQGRFDDINSNLSDLSGKLIDKSGLNAVNKYTKPQTISHNNGISANAYNNSPLQIVSVYNNANWSRAQISFHNVGANAAILYLDVDGRLKVCDNGGNIHVLAYQ